MRDEIEIKIDILKGKMEKMEVGSVQHDMYVQIMQELLSIRDGNKQVKLHKESDAVCDGCQ